MNTLEREKKGEEEKRDLRRTRRGDPSQTSRKAATTAMMTITTAAKRTAMKKARDLVRASSAGFELSFEWILCIFGGYVKEDLPPHLDSTSEPPPLFDGTTRCQLATWLDGIIYHSFLWYSEQSVDRCWSLSYIDPVDVRQRLPQVAHPLTHAVDGKYSSHCTSDSQQFQLAKLWMVFEWTGPNLQWRELHPPVLRRERIAERMRAMQEVVPSCNKSYGIKIGYGGISGPSGVRDGSSSQGGGCCS
ncbi:hypothetical protein RHGRI_000965 [Rhododendron griersonianum]|uniref:Uncharacterized protein n=1 Tax=Rhododendron griersonianum TaxID=479676 RepID=A0AAV6LIV7_9ERIC|nr:hypothetical protein RHGRI_000965 [Rhododendron griersonianum]